MHNPQAFGDQITRSGKIVVESIKTLDISDMPLEVDEVKYQPFYPSPVGGQLILNTAQTYLKQNGMLRNPNQESLQGRPSFVQKVIRRSGVLLRAPLCHFSFRHSCKGKTKSLSRTGTSDGRRLLGQNY